MGAPPAVDVWDPFLDVLFFYYAFGLQTVTCMVIGYYVAKRTTRSTFNWLATGFIAGLIPIAGVVFMLVALFFYPPPMPRATPGYHPPKSRESGGSARPGGRGADERRPKGRR